MTIYEALKKDHEKVKGLLTELLSLDEHDDHCDELIEQIRDDLIPHSRAEEAVFYNSIRALDADSGKVMHGYKEHVEAEALLRSLQVMEKTNMDWKKTALKLKEALEHHIQEEEGTIFALGKKVFSEAEATKLCEAFERLKPEVKEEGFMKTTLDLIANLMPPRVAKYLGDKEAPKSMKH